MPELSRRDLLTLLALTACGPRIAPPAAPAPVASAPSPAPRFALAEKSIAELGALLASGEETAVSLVDQYLARIEAIDENGPALRAIIEVNPDARAIAAARDREERRGPLHGIPIVLKDNIATADRMETTSGSLALVGHRPPRDATIVAQLRDAGAVILAKANLSEWANMRSRFSSSGWSSRGGQTKNPYGIGRNGCGSSTGSAVAVAANLCAAAIGTETLGSIVCPSSACGVVGLKPTVGRWSRAGIIPIATSTDTAGPITRSVADAALLLKAIGGADARDPITREVGALGALDLDPEALRGQRIGVARSFFGFHPEVDALIDKSLEAMRTRGAEIVDPVDLAFGGRLFDQVNTVFLYEFKAGVEAYLAELGPDAPKRLDDLIAFNRDHAEEVMPFFGQELFLAAREKGSLDEPAYREALATIVAAAGKNGIDRVVREHRLDAIVGPSGGPAWMTDHVNGDHFLGGSSAPAAIAGYPHISVPAGDVSGLPVGISFFGPAESDARLLAIAFAYEQATKHRHPPDLSPA